MLGKRPRNSRPVKRGKHRNKLWMGFHFIRKPVQTNLQNIRWILKISFIWNFGDVAGYIARCILSYWYFLSVRSQYTLNNRVSQFFEISGNNFKRQKHQHTKQIEYIMDGSSGESSENKFDFSQAIIMSRKWESWNYWGWKVSRNLKKTL